MSWRKIILVGLALLMVVVVGGVVWVSSKVRQFAAEQGGAGAYLAARQAIRDKDAARASAFYRQALEKDPGDEDLLRATMQAQILAGNITAGRNTANALIEHRPENQQAQVLLAITDFAEGRYERAIMHLDQMRPGPMSRLLEPNIRLWIALAQGDESARARVIEQLSRMSSFATISLMQAAEALEISGDMDAAEAHYANAAHTGGLRYLFFVKSYGAFLERQGKIDKARQTYTHYHDRHMHHPHILAAEARLVEGSDAPVLHKMPQRGLARGFLAIGEAMLGERRNELALAYTQLAYYLDAQNDLITYQLGDLMARRERWAQAEGYYRSIAPETPLYRESQIQRAQMLNEMDDTELAIEVLNKQLEQVPGHDNTLIALGDLYRANGRYEEAEKAYDIIISHLDKVEARHWHLYFSRGMIRERLGLWDQAETDLQNARKLSGDEPHVLNYLGYSWIDQGIYLDAGLAIIKQAVKKQPNNGSFVDSLGWAYFRLGKFQTALAFLERASQLVSTDPVITDHLGDALWRLDRKVEARYQWRKALAFDPDETDRGKIQQKLLTGLGKIEPLKPKARMPRGGTAI